jgi:hypothetical protein
MCFENTSFDLHILKFNVGGKNQYLKIVFVWELLFLLWGKHFLGWWPHGNEYLRTFAITFEMFSMHA